VAYNEVSSRFWSAVHETLSGSGSAAENLEILQIELEEMKGGGW
jgi:trehalose/maltose transport system substrate-binding protein